MIIIQSYGQTFKTKNHLNILTIKDTQIKTIISLQTFSYIFTVACMSITLIRIKVYYYIKTISTVKIICTFSSF